MMLLQSCHTLVRTKQYAGGSQEKIGLRFEGKLVRQWEWFRNLKGGILWDFPVFGNMLSGIEYFICQNTGS